MTLEDFKKRIRKGEQDILAILHEIEQETGVTVGDVNVETLSLYHHGERTPKTQILDVTIEFDL